MQKAISNTSPLLYLYRADLINLLPNIFNEIDTTQSVADELRRGLELGYDVPDLIHYKWLKIKENPKIPSGWLHKSLGKGEESVLIMGTENPDSILLMDDQLARTAAKIEGLKIFGTLKLLIDLKQKV